MSVEKIKSLYRDKKYDEALRELEIHIVNHQENPFLWVMRGNLIQLANEPDNVKKFTTGGYGKILFKSP